MSFDFAGFLSVPERLKEKDQTKELYKNPCTFGISYLDDALSGLYADDLVILTARTGAGKTEISVHIACENALIGKKVFLFALEAYRGEIENRLRYRLLATKFFQQPNWKTKEEKPSYQKWVYGKQKNILGEFEAGVDEELSQRFKNLHVYYRTESFGMVEFETAMHLICPEADLIVIDHLHHFDLETENEISEIKRTVKQMRDITMFFRKPTVLVAHVRKTDKRFETLTPELEDIYGSSEISKVCTKAIALAPAKNARVDGKPHLLLTHIKILKNRLDGSTTRYVASCPFNIQTNSYEQEYLIGREVYGKNEFKELEHSEWPAWAEHANSGAGEALSRVVGSQERAGYNPSWR